MHNSEGSLVLKRDLSLQKGNTELKLDLRDGMYLFFLYSDDGRINSIFKISVIR